MSEGDLAAIAAFLSGMGSVLSATWYVRKQRKTAGDECDKRIAEFERALHEGLEIARGDDAGTS